MTHFADLSPCSYFGAQFQSGLRAVGWLHTEHAFSRGFVSENFAHALMQLLQDPWQPAVFMGSHRCEFCRISGGPVMVGSPGGISVSVGFNNLFVPGDGFLYVAPSTIIHYIDAHEYAPPAEFQTAVLNCPPMRSMDYFKLVRKNAPADFITHFCRTISQTGDWNHETFGWGGWGKA